MCSYPGQNSTFRGFGMLVRPVDGQNQSPRRKPGEKHTTRRLINPRAGA